MNATPNQLLDRIAVAVRDNLPPGISPAYLDGFLARHRRTLVGVLERELRARRTRSGADKRVPLTDAPPELWTPAKRTAANLAAMRVAASTPPDRLTADDRRVLAGYSGWGGLSIDRVRDQFPAGFPAPEARGLIHEYYTPSKVTDEVARVLRPLLSDLAGPDGTVLTLEPSAGIGRFVRSLSGPDFEALRWLVVEWSQLSARMLQAIRPDLAVYNGPFERWVREHGDEYAGRIQLVVANPPYGQRGASITEDPVRDYREKQAYAYFLRRGLDLLVPNGLGVFLIPGGFLTGRGARNVALRDKVLKRHHLSAAYRLPSGLFPGAQLVTDLLFFRSRGGELAEVDAGDRFILDGGYFEQFPAHILGREVGKDGGDDDQTKKPRWGYQVVGEFTRLPDLVERKVCGQCVVRFDTPAPKPAKKTGVARSVDAATDGLPPELATAVALGLRVDTYLAALAAEDSREPEYLWHELYEALTAWHATHGNPWSNRKLRALVKKGVTGAERFLSAYEKTGRLIAGLRTKPTWQPRYRGRPDDVVAQAEMLYRTSRVLTAGELLAFHRKQGGALRTTDAVIEALVDGGWAVDDDHVLPMDDYLSGHLWPRVDRALERGRKGDGVAASQARKLLEVIQPAVFDDIEGVSARQGWIPLDLVQDWLSETLNGRYGAVELVRERGLVQVQGVDYEDIGKAYELAPEARWCIGWINHDKTVFRPKKRRDENLDEIRVAKAKAWDASFRAWVGSDDERRARVEEAYNRQFKGYVAPTYPSEPLAIARWVKDGIRLHPHQVAGARRLLANRGGLLAFDVGVGKTYTGIATLARARQEGWCRRPVILVPNSIVWKWEADIRRVLPDYRVAVIGSKRKVMTRGKRKDLVTSTTDTPQDRARKWTRFQAGEFDVVLLTYTALARTRMNEAAVRAYAEKTEAIQREVKLRQRNAANSKKLTERQEAILKEGVAAWVAEMMELPESWDYDPGIAWDDIGVDLLIVDEAQNFKNLYLPEAREGGVPRFMGNAGTGSKRAWQLDFRTAAIRRHTGGSGIVLLSATPAKNSPLEFYNLIQFIDHEAWSRMGIRDPEQFIDRYLRIELKPVVDTKMEVVERSAVTGFQNLHELREVIFRYGEFKTAEDVGLKLPEPTVNVVEVDMNADQDDKYERYVKAIEDALESTRPSDKAQILGLLARMALVAIHPSLDEGYSWKTALQVDAHSPKLDAMAERVAANRTCGHIVFVDNVAVHQWARQVLVESGIPKDRIAVLNATTAKAAADRQRIAKAFNGSPEDGIAPKYDVVIANAIAYEGIDLQTRTCAIHHLDLPWEPATLQQRNGRGVRQGNTLGAIEINYYFARRSQDGLRFNLIQATAITYCRVSSEEQAQKDISIPAQRKAIHRWADAQPGVQVVEDFVDQGISAYAPADKRPGFCDMVSFCRKNDVDLILVHKLDRFSRNREESILFKSLLRKHGVTVKSITENYDPDTPQGFLYEGMIEVINQFYSMNLATETLKGMRENAERGFHNGGRVPFGYRLEKVMVGAREHSKLVPGPDEEVATVREIFRLATDLAMGVKSIANELNKRGVPAPRSRHWNSSTVNHMLSNRVYVGDQVWFQSRKAGRDSRERTGEDDWIVTQDAHPALIDREVFEERQRIAESRQFMQPSRRKHVSYLLSRVMVCGCCGANFHGRRHKYTSKKTGKTTERFRYYCGAYLSKGPSVCKPLGVDRDWADALVMSTIRARLSSQGGLDELQKRVRERIEARRQVYGESSQRVDQKLAEIDRRIQNYYRAIGEGLDPLVCQQHIADLTEKKEQLEEEATVLAKQDYYDRAREKNLAQLRRFASLLERGGEDIPFAVKRQVVLHFIKKVEVVDREKLEITLRIPLDNEGIKLLTDELEATFQADVEVAEPSFRSGATRGPLPDRSERRPRPLHRADPGPRPRRHGAHRQHPWRGNHGLPDASLPLTPPRREFLAALHPRFRFGP